MALTLSNEDKIKGLFSSLLVEVRSAVEEAKIKVKDVRQYLIGIFECGDQCLPRANVEDIFNAVTSKKLWNYRHYSPVENFIKYFLPSKTTLMTDYKKNLTGFYTTTKLINYIRKMEDEDSSNKLSLQSAIEVHYCRLRVVLETKRTISELSLQYVQDIWTSFAEEFKLPFSTADIEKVLKGSLEVVYLILPHVAEKITLAASSQKAITFFHKLHTVYVTIDDHPIYDSKMVNPQILHVVVVLSKTIHIHFQVEHESKHLPPLEEPKWDVSSQMDTSTLMVDSTSSMGRPLYTTGGKSLNYSYIYVVRLT